MNVAELRAALTRDIVNALGASNVQVRGASREPTFIVRFIIPLSTRDARATHSLDGHTAARNEHALRAMGWRRDEVLLRAMRASSAPSLEVPYSFPGPHGFRPFGEVAAAVVALHVDVLGDVPASLEITRG